MIDLSIFDDSNNYLIVCPNAYKTRLLEAISSSHKLINLSFLSLNEYKKNILFDYDISSIKYLKDKDISVNNAIEILNNLYFIEDKEYKNTKLDYLRSIKEELINNDLLIFNPGFKEYLNNKKIVIIGYGELNRLDKSLFKEDTLFIDYKYNDKHYIINEFNNIEEEVEYLYDSIFDLINKDVDINNIYVLNADDEYESYFKRYNTYYNFNINYINSESILGTSIVSKFIELIDSNNRLDIYNYLNDINNDASNELIKLLNKYVNYDLKDIKELIINDIKKININNSYKDVVRCVDNYYEFNDNDYVFLIGFDDEYPRLKKDNEYLTNNLKDILNIPTVEEDNLLIKKNTINYLSNINNLFVSYAKISPFLNHNFETLIDNIEITHLELTNNYSENLNKTKLGYKLDKYRKYNYKDDELKELCKNYDYKDYLSYDNSFNSIDYHNDNLHLSYSSMNTYYECAFKYYLDNVLKLNDVEGNFYSKFGSLAHNVLEDFYKDKNMDFEKTWEKDLKKLIDEGNSFNDESEYFFVDKLKEEIRKDIQIMNNQHDESTFKDAITEQEINVKVNDSVNFKGFIDKLIYKQVEDHYLTAIVDYKTGDFKYNKKLNEFGLSLQLPCYMYLLRNSNHFLKDSKFVGIYIQNLINKNTKYDKDSSLDNEKVESMKLNGLSSSSLDRLRAFDTSLINGNRANALKGIAYKSDESFYAYSKVLDDEKLEELIYLTKDKILEASSTILKGEFSVNPKVIDGENMSCKYCSYRDICYRRNADLRFINTKDEEDQ